MSVGAGQQLWCGVSVQIAAAALKSAWHETQPLAAVPCETVDALAAVPVAGVPAVENNQARYN